MPDYLIDVNPEYNGELARVVSAKDVDEAVRLYKERTSVLVVPQNVEEFHALENFIRY